MSTNSKGYYRAGVWHKDEEGGGRRKKKKKRGKRKEAMAVVVARRGKLDNRTSVPRRVPVFSCPRLAYVHRDGIRFVEQNHASSLTNC